MKTSLVLIDLGLFWHFVVFIDVHKLEEIDYMVFDSFAAQDFLQTLQNDLVMRMAGQIRLPQVFRQNIGLIFQRWFVNQTFVQGCVVEKIHVHFSVEPDHILFCQILYQRTFLQLFFFVNIYQLFHESV